MFSSAVIGLTVGVLLFLFLTEVLKFMGAIPSIMDMAKIYAGIFITGTIFNLINVTSGNIAVSQGAAKVSLKAMIVGSVLNMILDPVFIYKFDLGVKGAAIATLISQLVTRFNVSVLFQRRKSFLEIRLINFKPTSRYL